MKVKELIEELSTHNPQAEIIFLNEIIEMKVLSIYSDDEPEVIFDLQEK